MPKILKPQPGHLCAPGFTSASPVSHVDFLGGRRSGAPRTLLDFASARRSQKRLPRSTCHRAHAADAAPPRRPAPTARSVLLTKPPGPTAPP